MGVKKVITLIEILAVTSLVSVGFSSWIITDPNGSPTVTGTLEAENVINNNNYITVKDYIFPEYGEKGFYYDYTVGDSKECVIKTEIEFNLSKFRSEVVNTDSFNFQIDLVAVTKFLNDTLISKADTLNVSYDYTLTPTAIKASPSFSYTTSTDQVPSTLSFSDLSGITQLTINLEYTLDLSTYFSTFYNYISNEDLSYDGVEFKVIATMESDENE